MKNLVEVLRHLLAPTQDLPEVVPASITYIVTSTTKKRASVVKF